MPVHDYQLSVLQSLLWLRVEFLYEVALAGLANFPEVFPLELRGIRRGGRIDGHGRGLYAVFPEEVAEYACFLERSGFRVGGDLTDGEGLQFRLRYAPIVDASFDQLLEGRR